MTIHVNPKHKVVVAPLSGALRNLFPAARTLVVEGRDLIVLPHGREETLTLRRLGHDCPAPISRYDWPGKTPFKVQKQTSTMLSLNRRGFVLNGMGTGKTASALWAWDFLNHEGDAGKLLVCAPLSTLQFTWAREIFSLLPGRHAVVLHGPKEKRLKALAIDADIYIINHDGLEVIWDELLARKDIDTLIIDELATFRNGKAKRTKTMRKLVAAMKWAWGMTGSPTPNGPGDAWAQCLLLAPERVPKFFTAWRDLTHTKMSQFLWKPKADALERVIDAMQPAVRFSLDDVLELPEVVELPVDVPMGPIQTKAYKEMKKAAFTLCESNEITAVNAGVVLGKLLQITLGWVYTKDGRTLHLDNEARVQRLLDDIDAVSEKVIVFVPYIHALEGIAAALTKANVDFACVSGETPPSKRVDIFAAFQDTNKYKVILAHPKCMAHGVTLTAASTIIWFSPTSDLEMFEQANARIRRIGQKHKQLVLMYQGSDVEVRSYKKLRAKQKVQTALLEMFAEETKA